MPVAKVDEFSFEEASITLRGVTYRFRELSVEENDEASEGSKQEDGTRDGRVMMRLMMMKSAIEPKITAAILAKMPQRVYLRLCDVINQLSDPETLKDEGTPNPPVVPLPSV